MTASRSTATVLCAITLLAAAGQCAAAPDQPGARAAAAPERLAARTPEGRLDYVVDTPDALTSSVSRVNTSGPVTPGYTFTSRVVVRAADLPLVQALVGAAAPGQPMTVAPADPTGVGLRGLWVVSAPSVRAAIALADALAADPRVQRVELDTIRPRVDRTLPTDPAVPQQWYLNNTVNPQADLNVEPAWDAGFTGAGITIGILEGGFNAAHPDLAPKFHPEASQPDLGFTNHGCSTAGLAGMAANNGIFGAGVAYGARLARLYYGSDIETGNAFLFRNDLTSVKSQSWGPFDIGTIAFIAAAEAQGLADSVATGRAGKGEVFTWAAGNGATSNDRVDYDPYASDRHVIAVGAVDNADRRATYSEPGSSLMLVTTSNYDFSSSGGSGIYTLTGSGDRPDFGGTSATSPLAAGVVALMLQANPNLTWRDVQHVLIRSARRCAPTNPGWTANAAGLFHSYDFGFGAIDAAAAVTLAQTWINRTPEITVQSPLALVGNLVPDNFPAGVSSTIVLGANLRIERVQIEFTALHPRLGDYRVQLTSPSGTSSVFAEPRSDFTQGYSAYTFTSVRHWDELAKGAWTLNISDRVAGTTGTFDNWRIRVFGTTRPCPCDWNASGTVTVQDIFDFLADFFAGTGDFNNDGATSVQDVFDLLGCWFSPPQGCL